MYTDINVFLNVDNFAGNNIYWITFYVMYINHTDQNIQQNKNFATECTYVGCQEPNS